jgi:hypothetical protein
VLAISQNAVTHREARTILEGLPTLWTHQRPLSSDAEVVYSASKTVVAICACTVLSLVPMFIFVGKNFQPTDDRSQFNVMLRTPEGTSMASTTNEAAIIAQAIRRLPATAGGDDIDHHERIDRYVGVGQAKGSSDSGRKRIEQFQIDSLQ